MGKRIAFINGCSPGKFKGWAGYWNEFDWSIGTIVSEAAGVGKMALAIGGRNCA